MKVAINIAPLESGHKTRGIGFYTRNLIEALKNEDVELNPFKDIREVKFADVIHYPWFDLFFYTLPLIRRFPTVVTIHDVIPLVYQSHYPTGIKAKINFFIQRVALQGCKAVITDSKKSKEDIIELLKLNSDRVFVVPLAADPVFKVISDAEKLKVKMKYRLPDKFILYVGDVNYVKNLPFLIEGFANLLKLDGFQNIKLVLVGGMFLKNVDNIDHPELEDIKKVNKLIKENNLESSVLKPGQVDIEDLVGIANLATVYIQPSYYEGFGLPILEAMSCGTPVISSKGGSLPEVGGDAVLYFDPTDLNHFINTIKYALENESLLRKLSKLGIKQSEKFSWQKVASQTLSVYKYAASK